MTDPATPPAPVTLPEIAARKTGGEALVMVTAYDYTGAVLADRAGVDMVLVGDSVGMVVLGYESTIPVTMDEMVHHTRAVSRGCRRPFLIADMPFMSYQTGVEEAVRNAGRLVKEGGAAAVKLEGGREVLPQVRAIAAAGIPVMGHLGLTPQAVTKLGGYRVQGRDAAGARRILEDALLLEEAGAFAVLVECIPDRLAGLLRRRLRVPLIGIGAGPDCDGQVLVFHDLLGLYDRITPRFVKRYADLGAAAVQAIAAFAAEVREGRFPAKEHSFSLPDEEMAVLLRTLEDR